jgi:16S rRNA (uracil1498-N3)-methyltransferase
MRLHRFFIDQIVGEKTELVITDENHIHQWKRVFRYKKGDTVILFDNSGYEYTGSIDSLESDEARITITKAVLKKKEHDLEIYLFASLTKKDTFEWMMEKVTELGVARIIPLLSERSEKKGLNLDRAKKILVEAGEQSGRVEVPRLYEITHLADALTHYDIPVVAFDPDGKKFDAEARTQLTETKGPLAVYIGPEGGWSDAELALFKEKKATIYSLGEQVLRAETASAAVVSLLMLGR